MRFPFNVPGYVMGHRYCSDARFYDAARNRFIDTAGYGDLDQHQVPMAGAPRFSLHGPNNREGLLLDNANPWWVACPTPWEGCVVAVVKTHIPTPFSTLRWWNVGNNPTLGQNAGMTLFNDNTGQIGLGGSTPGGLVWPTVRIPDGIISVIGWQADQEMRTLSTTKDFVTVLTSAPAAAQASGRPAAIGGAAYAGNVGLLGDPRIKMERLGNNLASGAIGDYTANATDYMWVFERHYFKGVPMRTNLAELKAFADSLVTYYPS